MRPSPLNFTPFCSVCEPEWRSAQILNTELCDIVRKQHFGSTKDLVHFFSPPFKISDMKIYFSTLGCTVECYLSPYRFLLLAPVLSHPSNKSLKQATSFKIEKVLWNTCWSFHWLSITVDNYGKIMFSNPEYMKRPLKTIITIIIKSWNSYKILKGQATLKLKQYKKNLQFG